MGEHPWVYAALALIIWVSCTFVFLCVFHIFAEFEDKDDDE